MSKTPSTETRLRSMTRLYKDAKASSENLGQKLVEANRAIVALRHELQEWKVRHDALIAAIGRTAAADAGKVKPNNGEEA